MHAAGTENTQTLLAQLFGKLVAAGRAAVGKGKKTKDRGQTTARRALLCISGMQSKCRWLGPENWELCFGFRR